MLSVIIGLIALVLFALLIGIVFILPTKILTIVATILLIVFLAPMILTIAGTVGDDLVYYSRTSKWLRKVLKKEWYEEH